MADEAPQTKKDVVPSAYRDKYKQTGGTNGDFIATALQKVGEDGLPALQTVMKENKIDGKRWEGANVGMQRMNLSNVLRSTFLNGGDIYILGKQYNLLHLRDDYNGEIENSDKSIAKFAETVGLAAQGQKASDRVIKAIRRTLFEAAEKAKKEQERTDAKAKRETEAAAKKKAREDAAAKKKTDAATAKADKAAKKKADDEAKAKKKADDAKAKADKAAKKKADDAAKAKAVAKPAAPVKQTEPA